MCRCIGMDSNKFDYIATLREIDEALNSSDYSYIKFIDGIDMQ